MPLPVIGIGDLVSYLMVPPINVKPWIETGYPVQQTEVWRTRVCLFHHTLYTRNPYSPARPLHAVLGLDANARQFHPAKLSASPDQPFHQAVYHTIADAFAKATGNKVQFMAANLVPLELDEQDVDRVWVYTIMSVVSLLSDDTICAHYAYGFVPALTEGFGDMMKTDEGIRNARLSALKILCN
ncbi:Ff.00g065690.m01.CDS01 [Fusarium sp. VM40]|nr:Ff.00g065690.m01.CDS01 [Fusarium sp. VM40]